MPSDEGSLYSDDAMELVIEEEEEFLTSSRLKFVDPVQTDL